MKKKLADILKNAGKDVSIHKGADGSEILILPHGGRILGLYAPENTENFLWTNKALDDEKTATEFYHSDEWCNSGGDRTWLSPEIDFFIPKFPDLSEYYQPRSLDPGNYTFKCLRNSVLLENQLTLIPLRHKKQIELNITKEITDAPNPLRYEKYFAELAKKMEYAGYTLKTTLKFTDNGDDNYNVSIWNLLQLPHGGSLIVPTYSNTQPKVYIGNIPAEDIIVNEQLILYHMRAKGGYKIGIKGFATTGRIGYLYNQGTLSSLVIRNFKIDPSGDYIDVPYDDINDFGYAVQACSADVEAYTFSELEYHTPAIGKNTNQNHYTDNSQVWAFRASEEEIRKVAKILLSAHL